VNKWTKASYYTWLGGAAILLIMIFLIAYPSNTQAALSERGLEEEKKVGPARPDVSQINMYNRVHRRSNIWMNITNYGYFGNDDAGRSTAYDDP
jgi:hypothetical protein